MAVFSMLFGAGTALMSGRAGAEAGTLHHRRMAWLIVFGLLHAYVLWYGHNLFTSRVCRLVAYACRDMKPSALLPAAFALLLAGAAIPVALGSTVPPDKLAEMSAQDWKPAPEVIDAELTAYRGGFLAQSRHRVPESLKFQTFYLLFTVFWRVLGLMLLGMALFRLDVVTARLAPRQYAALALLGFGVGLPLVIAGVQQNFAHDWSIEYAMRGGGLWNYWGSVAMALGYTGLVMWIVRAGVLAWLTSRLADLGRMAFSNYILQTLIATTIFYGHGLGLFGSVERTGQLAIVLAICALQLVVSALWLRHFRFGPLEWGWRRLSYGRRLRLKTED